MEVAWQQIKERARVYAVKGQKLTRSQAASDVLEILHKRALEAPEVAVEFLAGEMLAEYTRLRQNDLGRGR